MFNIEVKRDFNISYDKSVLIIIDMIKGFTDIGNLKSEFIKSISEDIKNASLKFSHIVSINDSHTKDDCEFNSFPMHCIKGSEESKICDELRDVNFEHFLYKNSTNGFFAYGFMDVFKYYIDNNFDFVVVGCCTDICILQFCTTFKSYLNSINKNLNVIVPKDLVETYDCKNHEREKVTNVSLYLMQNSGIILIDRLL